MGPDRVVGFGLGSQVDLEYLGGAGVDDVDARARSPTFARWSKAAPSLPTQAATNVLRTINTIAAGLGLDDDADNDRSDEMAGVT